TGNLGKILRLENGEAAGGWVESPVRDGGTGARWGRLSWRGGASGLSFRTRAGNAARPDATWSDWANPISNPAPAAFTSPNARYIQWRVELSGASSPALEGVTIAYLPQNTPPMVHSIGVTAQPGAAKTSAGNSAAYTVTVTDSADAAGAGAAQTISRG